jgi:anti-anti-sigma factor
MSQFKLSERRIWPGCVEIELEGELDFQVSDRLRSALEAAGEEPCHVLVSFAGCDFIDSSALAVLVDADREFAARGKQLLLYGMRGQVRRLFAVMGLTESGELWTPPWDQEARPRGTSGRSQLAATRLAA